MVTENTAEAAKDTQPVPYVSFVTLTNMLDRLNKLPAHPTRVDKSVLAYLSSGYRSQMLAGLRGLTLIDANGRPSQELLDLISQPDQRPTLIGNIWRRVYADVFSSIDVSAATAGELNEQFARYGVNSATRDKAIAFFVAGCVFAQIPLSALISDGAKRMRGASAPRKPKALGGNNGTGAQGGVDPTTQQQMPDYLKIGVHPMLSGAILWLAENGPTWTADQSSAWCTQFEGMVKLVYPVQDSAQRSAQREPVAVED